MLCTEFRKTVTDTVDENDGWRKIARVREGAVSVDRRTGDWVVPPFRVVTNRQS